MSKVSSRRLDKRQRDWVLAVGILALVLSYLTWWTTYSYTHLSANSQFMQLEPGAIAERGDGAFRLDRLVQSETLADQTGGQAEIAAAGSVWVIAELTVVPAKSGSFLSCEVSLVGPDQRRWTSDSPPVSRTNPRYCPDDKALAGQPLRFEALFAVPSRYVDQIVGVAVPDPTTSDPTPVLRPAS